MKAATDWNRAEQEIVESSDAKREAPKEWIKFQKPTELRDYQPPEGMILVGDCHVVRAGVFVIGGAPGVGKSRSAVALGVAGATGQDWFGLKVHRKFKTMILQNENGRFRLSREFADLDCAVLDDWLRVCTPPDYGMALDKPEFVEAVAAAIGEFKPEIVILDPWNAAARDDKAADYLATFNALHGMLPTGDDAPALGIVAHTRKPKGDERTSGRGLLHLLTGSYVLGSVPRSAFVMQAASDDTEDRRIVWTCAKNNDGDMGGRSAWERRNGLFAPVQSFDWETFDRAPGERRGITEADVAKVFEDGQAKLSRKEAVRLLMEQTKLGHTACYLTLRASGRFGAKLVEEGGLLSWKP